MPTPKQAIDGSERAVQSAMNSLQAAKERLKGFAEAVDPKHREAVEMARGRLIKAIKEVEVALAHIEGI